MTDKPRIVFVDDEQRVLNAMRALFRRDYELFLTTKGADAIRLAEEHNVDVLVADQRMPGMTGVEVLEQVKNRAPATVRILLTGYADLDAIEASINNGEVFRFLSKPCPPNELRATLQQAVLTARATAAAAAAAIVVESVKPDPEPEIPPDVPELANEETQTSATIVPFPSTGDTGNNAVISSDDETDVNEILQAEDTETNEVILAGDTVTHTSTSMPSENTRIGIAVYTIDPGFAETAAKALRSHQDISIATNLIAVTKILEQQRAGVLLTDLTDNVAVLRSMIGTLKQRLPELVVIVASENRDASEMISLINHGQVFRYIKKPLDTGTLLTDVNAAIIKHQQLVQHPELIQRHAVVETDDPQSKAPKLIQFIDHLSKIRRPWRNSGS